MEGHRTWSRGGVELEPAGSAGAAQPQCHRSAFIELYDRMLPVVFGYCRARLAEHDAEDVTAEVFRAALQRLEEDPGVQLDRGWFLTVARNRIVDRWRHQARWRSRLATLAATEARRSEAQVDDGARGVLDLLDRLPATQRAAVVLHHIDGHTIAEIADLLGSTPRAVESLLARGRRKLRSAVEEEEGVCVEP